MEGNWNAGKNSCQLDIECCRSRETDFESPMLVLCCHGNDKLCLTCFVLKLTQM